MPTPADLSILARTAALLVEQRDASAGAARKCIESLLNHLCREVEDLAPRNVSVAAAEEAARRGLGDLRVYHWDDQVTRMRDRGRAMFHWDHHTPVAELRRALLAPSQRAVPAAVLSRARIVWITKAEDRRLTELGFRDRRPDPAAAYRAARIELAHPWGPVAEA